MTTKTTFKKLFGGHKIYKQICDLFVPYLDEDDEASIYCSLCDEFILYNELSRFINDDTDAYDGPGYYNAIKCKPSSNKFYEYVNSIIANIEHHRVKKHKEHDETYDSDDDSETYEEIEGNDELIVQLKREIKQQEQLKIKLDMAKLNVKKTKCQLKLHKKGTTFMKKYEESYKEKQKRLAELEDIKQEKLHEKIDE